MTEEIAKKV